MKSFVVLLSVAALAYASPVPQEESVLKSVVGNFVNCINSDLNLCIKEHALRATERLGTVRKLQIVEGITILNNGPKEARSLEPLSTEPQVRNKQITERLWEKASDLLQNGELELSYGGEEEESRALGENVEEGRSGKKKDIKKKMKMLMPLAMLIKAKAIALAVLFLGVIAVSLWKLAVIAKIAFIAKLIGIIKMLLAKKHQEDHGWAPAHDEHAHGHGGWEQSQGWGRSRNEAADMAYAAYKQH